MNARRVRDGKDPLQEDLMARANALLQPLQTELDEAHEPGGPTSLLFLVGHQRCGSTLLGQVLAAGLDVAYPSNIVARFWLAPLVGVQLQRALFGPAPALPSSFRSHVGTTESPLEPHEFSYFWHHWFPEHGRCRDASALERLLAHWSAVCGQPLLFKNNWSSLRIELLARLFPGARFVHARRNLRDVARSCLRIRRHRFGSEEAWFGLDPPGWEALRSLPAVEQVAGQLHLSEMAIEAGLAALDPARWVAVAYEELCADPAGQLAAVTALGFSTDGGASSLPAGFTPARAEADADPALDAALAAHFDPEAIARGTRLP